MALLNSHRYSFVTHTVFWVFGVGSAFATLPVSTACSPLTLGRINSTSIIWKQEEGRKEGCEHTSKKNFIKNYQAPQPK